MRYFTSDLHLGHAKILEYTPRPFGSPEEMNEGIIARWNDQVKPEDDVLVLGDFAMGKIAETLPIAGQLNGSKVLVCGNHDRPWQGHGDESEKQESWRDKYEAAGFRVVCDTGNFNDIIWQVHGIPVRASHFPFDADERHGDRFAQWQPADGGGDWLLHGHVHDAWLQRGRQINIGIDAWGGELVTEDTLRALMSGGPANRKPLPWL